jgi:hypothetical protein
LNQQRTIRLKSTSSFAPLILLKNHIRQGLSFFGIIFDCSTCGIKGPC